MRDLITIIVPIYKAADYIEKCVESLFAQTYDNIEYYFMNDCTPDNSIELLKNVLDKYPNRREKVNIISFEHNQGHANLRNYALKRCNGKYVIQIDSDDYTDVSMIEKMYELIMREGADICCCDYYDMRNDGNHLCVIPEDMVFKDSVKNFKIALSYSAHWNKLIKTSLIRDKNIYCIENINNWVDIGQTLRLRMAASKIVLLHEPLYFYNHINPNSVSLHYTEKRAINMMHTATILRDYLLEFGDEYKPVANYLLYYTKMYYICNGNTMYKKWRSLYPECHKYIWKYPISLKQKIASFFIVYHMDFLLNLFR